MANGILDVDDEEWIEDRSTLPTKELTVVNWLYDSNPRIPYDRDARVNFFCGGTHEDGWSLRVDVDNLANMALDEIALPRDMIEKLGLKVFDVIRVNRHLDIIDVSHPPVDPTRALRHTMVLVHEQAKARKRYDDVTALISEVAAAFDDHL